MDPSTLPIEVQEKLAQLDKLIQRRRASSSRYLAAHKERHNECSKAYYHRNKELVRERVRQRYQNKVKKQKEGWGSPSLSRSRSSSPLRIQLDPSFA
jgi:hypothetical protein